MIEHKLSQEETKQVYQEICNLKLNPFNENVDKKYSEFYYELNGNQYRLIYDQGGDWFCDIIYQGNYK